jgi:hypothetical protein
LDYGAVLSEGEQYNGRWSGWQIGMEGIRVNEARIR